jgi:hypothetical protein
MPELGETVQEAVEKGAESRLNTIIASLVAVTATFMALCNVKGGNVVQAMAKAQVNAVDTWGYYQAKSTKQALAESVAEQLNFTREAQAGKTPQLAQLDQRIAEYRTRVSRYEGEKDELKRKAEAFEKEYDTLNVRDDQFDMAEAAMSVGIAMFGITALTRKRWLLAFAAAVAAFGVVLGLAGFLGWNIHPEFLAKMLG